MKPRSAALLIPVIAVYLFLLLPIFIVLLSSINSAAYLSFPPKGFSIKWYEAFFASKAFMKALQLSFIVALATSVIATLIATPAALYYVRYLRRGREQFRITMLAPLLLPEVLTAIALLFFFNHLYFGARSIIPLLVGHVVVTLPLVFLTVTSALYNMPAGVEEAARTLGANPWNTFRRITFPLIKSGVVTGSMLSFILSFDNVNISLLLKPVGSTTLPIQLFDYLRYDFDPTVAAASTISVLLTLLIIIAIDRLYGLRSLRF